MLMIPLMARQARQLTDNNYELQQDLKRQSRLKYFRLYGYGGWRVDTWKFSLERFLRIIAHF